MARKTQQIQNTLPPEVLISISEFIDTLADLNALARTNRFFYDLLNTRLYSRDVTGHNAWALTWAATHNKKSTAKRSINAGADVQGITDKDPRIKGCTPLLLAAYHGNMDVLQMLLEIKEVNPNSRDRKYIRPPLSWAVMQGHSSVVRTLLNDPRVNVNLEDNRGQTPLMYAASDSPNLITVLLQKGHADPRITNHQGISPLARAAQKDIEETSLLLAAHVQLVLDGDDRDEHCQHIFFYAAVTGSLDVVKYMVEYFGDKLDPNGADENGFGRGAFSIAAECDRVEVVRYLCGWEKTNPNLRDSWERDTPLINAAKDGRAEIVKALLDCDRVNLEQGNARGTTALGMAASTNRPDIIRLLLSGPRRADPHYPDDNTQTPLYIAAAFGHLEAVEALLGDEELDPMLGDEIDDMTPLEAAKEYGRDAVVEMLESHLAEKGYRDVDRESYM